MLDAGNRAALKQTLADTATLVHALAAQQGTIAAGVADAARTARNAARASDWLGPAIDRVAASADALAKMGADVSRTSDGAGLAVAAAASDVRQIGTETLPEVQRLLAALNALAASARSLSEQTAQPEQPDTRRAARAPRAGRAGATMKIASRTPGRRLRIAAGPGLLLVTGLAGCRSLLQAPPEPPALFVLEDASPQPSDAPLKPVAGTATSTLVVAEPGAAPGHGTRQIAYVRKANQIEYFAFSQWVEPPAPMLAALLASAIERTGDFRAVVRAPVSVAGDLRLETERVRLQQDFTVAPSRVRLTLRAVLVDTATRRVLASREFDADEAAASEDPAGGVMAANVVARRVAAAAFCAEWSSNRR